MTINYKQFKFQSISVQVVVVTAYNVRCYGHYIFRQDFLHTYTFIEKSVSLGTQLDQFTHKFKGKEMFHWIKVKFRETNEPFTLQSHNFGVTDITF